MCQSQEIHIDKTLSSNPQTPFRCHTQPELLLWEGLFGCRRVKQRPLHFLRHLPRLDVAQNLGVPPDSDPDFEAALLTEVGSGAFPNAGGVSRSAGPSRGEERVGSRNGRCGERELTGKSPGAFSELKLAVPWGHIAAKAWGSRSSCPVLCLHGWLDNANTFDRLIPLLPRDFYYVAMDFGGHGLSSHYSPGVLYHVENFVSEVRRVTAALKWNRFSIIGHSFGGTVAGTFSCVFPEVVDKLIILDSIPFALDTNEVEHLPTYRRKLIEHTLQQDEASRKPSRVYSQEEILHRVKTDTHVWEEFAEVLLQRGTSRVATEAAKEGYNNVVREKSDAKEPLLFMTETLKSVLKERFQYVEVPGNHCVHINQPNHVAGVISSFLESEDSPKAQE